MTEKQTQLDTKRKDMSGRSVDIMNNMSAECKNLWNEINVLLADENLKT